MTEILDLLYSTYADILYAIIIIITIITHIIMGSGCI